MRPETIDRTGGISGGASGLARPRGQSDQRQKLRRQTPARLCVLLVVESCTRPPVKPNAPPRRGLPDVHCPAAAKRITAGRRLIHGAGAVSSSGAPMPAPRASLRRRRRCHPRDARSRRAHFANIGYRNHCQLRIRCVLSIRESTALVVFTRRGRPSVRARRRARRRQTKVGASGGVEAADASRLEVLARDGIMVLACTKEPATRR